jgi:GNAT superfamily N-acetyltransferase
MTPEPTARRALLGDEEEIVRLRSVMWLAIGRTFPEGDTSRELAVERARAWLKEGEAARTAAFVVDSPDGTGLVSSAIGAIDERLPSPYNPSGLKGYVYGVATDEAFRRRGFTVSTMRALLDWYAEQGVLGVDLHASTFAEGLYRRLGFERPDGAALSLRLEPREASE